MKKLSKREQRLLEIVRKLLKLIDAYSIFTGMLIQDMRWFKSASTELGFDDGWRKEILGFIEKEYDKE